MRQLSIDDLFDLADTEDARARVEKLFDWHFERHKVVVEAVMVSLGAIVAGLLVAFLSEDVALLAFALALLAASFGLGTVGVLAYLELRSQKEDFLHALKILDAIVRYRGGG